MAVQRWKDCGDCNATGLIPANVTGETPDECTKCGGLGDIEYTFYGLGENAATSGGKGDGPNVLQRGMRVHTKPDGYTGTIVSTYWSGYGRKRKGDGRVRMYAVSLGIGSPIHYPADHLEHAPPTGQRWSASIKGYLDDNAATSGGDGDGPDSPNSRAPQGETCWYCRLRITEHKPGWFIKPSFGYTGAFYVHADCMAGIAAQAGGR